MGLTQLKQYGADLQRLKSDKQRLFAMALAINPDKPMEAAIKAGYSKASAAVTAQKLLKNPIIKAFIGKAQLHDVEQLELDRQEVLRQLWYLLTRRASDFVGEDGCILPIHEMSDRAQACVDGFEQTMFEDPENGTRRIRTKLKLTPKATAVDMAMKHKGLFAPDKVDARVLHVNWDDLVGGAVPPTIDGQDSLEAEIARAALPAPAHNGAGSNGHTRKP